MDDAAVREQVASVEARLARLEELPDADARDASLSAVEGLLALYGEALRRITERVAPAALADDELVSHLLLLHGLQKKPLRERVQRALEEVRPYIDSHGGGIELVEIAGAVARVRLHGSCQGCRASTQTLKLAVEEAVLRAAPELEGVEAIDQQAPTHDPPGPLLPMYGAPA